MGFSYNTITCNSVSVMPCLFQHTRRAQGCHDYNHYNTLVLAKAATCRGLRIQYRFGNWVKLFPRDQIIDVLQRDDDNIPCRHLSLPLDPSQRSNMYQLYSRSELVMSASNRGLRLKSHPIMTSTVEYIAALKLADEQATFRFLDLPPEMRILIYENLLRIDPDSTTHSTTCFPEILRTSKQVYSESQLILYTDNRVKIQISPDKIEVNGVRYGTHIPCAEYSSERGPEPHLLETIVWPDLLRRLRMIAIEVPENDWFYDEEQLDQVPAERRINVIQNVIYSLCSTLSSNHKCRNLAVLRRDYSQKTTAAELIKTYYPMRLLGAETVKIIHDDFGSLGMIDLRNDECYRQATALLQEFDDPPKAVLLYRAVVLGDRISLKSSSPYDGWALERDEIVSTMLALQEGVTSAGRDRDEIVEACLDYTIGYIRDSMAGEWIEDDRLVDEANQVLMLEIELRAFRETEKQVSGSSDKEELNGDEVGGLVFSAVRVAADCKPCPFSEVKTVGDV